MDRWWLNESGMEEGVEVVGDEEDGEGGRNRGYDEGNEAIEEC